MFWGMRLHMSIHSWATSSSVNGWLAEVGGAAGSSAGWCACCVFRSPLSNTSKVSPILLSLMRGLGFAGCGAGVAVDGWAEGMGAAVAQGVAFGCCDA